MEWLPFQEIGFSPEYERVLQDTVIDENGPGTILRDFEALLAFLGAQRLRVTPRHQLPRRLLPAINARLANPLDLGLKSPLQKSYPHVNGLYLLVLASGLATVGGESERLLAIDDAVYRAWQDLNPTERYFTLLEAWLLRGYPELIAEQGRRWYGMPETFNHCSRFVRRIPDAGIPVGDDEEIERRLRFRPGWHNLGLLELFGLVAVQHNPPEPGRGWRIQSLHRTPLGDALITLLYLQFFDDVDQVRHLRDAPEIPFGVLQPVLQTYFPEWKRALPIPGREHLDATSVRPRDRDEPARDAGGKQWLDVLIKDDSDSETRAADVRAEADELTSLILATNDRNDDG